jgi:hypothetical protein
VAGYDPGLIAREGRLIWEKRAWRSLTSLSESADETWLRARRTPLGKERDYLPGFAFC